MSGASTRDLIRLAVERVVTEAPALRQLKLVVALELRGRGDVQLYRLEMPGPMVSKDPAADARVRLTVSRQEFNELARGGGLAEWRAAFDGGSAKASGPEQVLRLIANVAARQEARSRGGRRPS